jgi:phosphomannomutase
MSTSRCPSVPPASTLVEACERGEPDALATLTRSVFPLRPSRLVPRPWGGRRLAAFTGLPAPVGQRVGEAFLVAAHDQDDEARRYPSLAQLPDGSELPLPALLALAGPGLVGEAHWELHGACWPLLPKILDVGALLSVQAHPPGQPEVYVVIDAEPGATLGLGFRQELDRDALERALREARDIQDRLAEALKPGVDERSLEGLLTGWMRHAALPARSLLPALHALLRQPPEDLDAQLETLRSAHLRLLDAMHHIPVRPGMVLYNRQLAIPAAGELPSADVHALGNAAGRSVLLLEIRLPGGTLRAWDHARFPRRRLDLGPALDALPLAPVPAGWFEVQPRPLRPGVARSVACELFSLDHLQPRPGRHLQLPALPGASTVHALRGQAQLHSPDGALLARLEPGDSALIPAGLPTALAALGPDPEVLHVTLPSRGAAVGSNAAQHDRQRSAAALSHGAAVGSNAAQHDRQRSAAALSHGAAVGSNAAQHDGQRSAAALSHGAAVGSNTAQHDGQRSAAALSRGAAVGSNAAQHDGQRSVMLKFGTSGLRGLVSDMTDREVYLNSAGFVRFLEARGELPPGAPLAIGEDLRARCSATGLESSPRIARAVARACADAGHPVIHCGRLPTPALAYWASTDRPEQGKRPMPAIMITGSHIPSDRNGVKFYKLRGEVLKSDEADILTAVTQAREAEAATPAEESLFDAAGAFRQRAPTPPDSPAAQRAYLDRYLAAFGRDRPLGGRKVVFFEHSAVGRDLLVELLEALGAEVVRLGRTDAFVAIDTEDMSEQALERFAAMVREHQPFALVSTDGDSDRPLLIDEQGCFHRGDLLGLVTALQLSADYAAVPVSTNDAVDRHLEALAATGGPSVTLSKTRIGSPWVIAAMQAAEERGHRAVTGWEANGGFLLGSALSMGEGTLEALPTRDAALPLLAVLVGAARQDQPVSALFADLPARHASAALIDGVPPAISRRVLARLAPDGQPDRGRIAQAFTAVPGLGEIAWIDVLDGLRIGFDSGEILHLRPSGNAPQLRCYAVSDQRARTLELLERALLAPDSAVRRLVAQIHPVAASDDGRG